MLINNSYLKTFKQFFIYSSLGITALSTVACSTFFDPRSGNEIHPEPAVTNPTDLGSLFPKSDFALPKHLADIRNVRKYILPQGTSTRQLPDLISRLQVGMTMSNLNSSQVDKFIKTYSHQASLNKTLKRAQYFLFDIIEELEARQMPSELALLPIVESSFITNATSGAKAVGVWQFIPITGKRFKLTQNNWLDERGFTPKATKAAFDYLEFLYNRFGNWHLALAAYNCGEGCVDRALKKLDRHYSQLTYDDLPIPKETMQYAPRLQALKEIFADPHKFGINLIRIPNKKITTKINADVPIQNSVAAEFAGISLEEFEFLNAHLKKDLYHPSLGELILPVSSVINFLDGLNNYEGYGTNWQIHQVARNENLSSIAKKFGTTVASVKKANPEFLGNLTTDSFLVIPTNKNQKGTKTINGKNSVNQLPKIVATKKSKTKKKTRKKAKKTKKKSRKKKKASAKPATKEEILRSKSKALKLKYTKKSKR